MHSASVILTAIISGVGFLLNVGMLSLLLSKGRKLYHYLFAAILSICAVWDIGILLSMLRNDHKQELIIYGYIVFLPCTLLAALIYQFTTTYLRESRKRAVVFFWAVSVFGFIGIATGLGGRIDGIFQYSWGNIYKPDRTLQIGSLVSILVGGFATLFSSWMFFRASKHEISPIHKRHMSYIAVSFMALTLANIKLAVLYNMDCPFLLPAGMFVNDVFSAVIAIAIIKHQLFDITIIIKKGAMYSALAAIVVFVFSFMEHVLITYLGEVIGGHSQWVHFISIAVGIAVLLPLKHRIEAAVERYFAEKRIEF
jgi:hypothetical protein